MAEPDGRKEDASLGTPVDALELWSLQSPDRYSCLWTVTWAERGWQGMGLANALSFQVRWVTSSYSLSVMDVQSCSENFSDLPNATLISRI